MSGTTFRPAVSSAADKFTVLVFEQCGLQEDICRALDETQRWHERDCALKAPLMMSFVLLLALHRHESIRSVLNDMLAYLRIIEPELSSRAVTSEAAIHSRSRLGVEPLKALFEIRARFARADACVFGLRPWSVDGVRFLIPDTPANEEHFGRPKASRGTAAFPQMLGTVLVSATSRMVRDAVWDAHTGSEREACHSMLRHLGPGDILFGDRGMAAAWLMEACFKQKSHFVFRIPSNWRPTKLKSLGDGDYLAIVQARVPITNEDGSVPKKGPKTRPVAVTVRVIEYRIGKCDRVRLVTDLLEPERYPALELAQQYHLRWEGELAFDEIKTHFSTVLGGTLDTTFRSKTSDGVLQEAYAVLIAYNLLRELIGEAAQQHGVPELEISFVETLVTVRRSIVRLQFAGRRELQHLRGQLLDEVAACRLKRSRRVRSYPRVIKVKMSKWKLKRRKHREQPAPTDGGMKLVRSYSKRRTKVATGRPAATGRAASGAARPR